MKLPTALSPLRNGAFARYIAGESVSMVGTWMQTFAQGWVLTSLTSSAFALGAINFTQGLPMLLLTLVGGSMADRYDKRGIIIAALTIQFLSAAILGALIATDRIFVWHIFVAAAFLGIAAAFEVPAVSAFVPELVPRGEISQALAIDRSVFHATRLIGPAVGGYLVATLGDASAYFANALSFVPLGLAILTIPPRTIGTAEEEAERRGSMGAGIAYVRKDSPTLAMVGLIVASTLFVSPFIVIMMPIYARLTLGLDAYRMGELMGVSGIGSLIGSIGVLTIPHGRRALALKIGAIVVVAGLLGLASAPTFGWAVASLIPMLVGLSTCFSVANIVVQERAPNELRGRISAVVALSFFGLIPFSGLLISGLIDLLGMRFTMASGAICYGVAAFSLLAGRRQLASAPETVPVPSTP